MSEGGDGTSFLWENHQLAAFSNSDIKFDGVDEEKSGKSLLQQQEPLPEESKQIQDCPEEVVRNGKSKDQVKEGKAGCYDTGGTADESDHDIHIWTERERRKKMRNMFDNLHALLPQLPPKADKSTIVDEAVNYIKSLEQQLQCLERQKLERHQGALSFGYEAPVLTSQSQKLAFDSRELGNLADHHLGSSYGGVANAITTATSTTLSNPFIGPRFPGTVVFNTWSSRNVVLSVCGNEAQICVCAPKKPRLFTAVCYVLEEHEIEVISAHVSSDSNLTMYMIQARGKGASNLFSDKSHQMEESYKQAAAEIMRLVSS